MTDIVNTLADIRQKKNPEIIACIASGMSIRETAEKCHVSTMTITRRLKRPAFLRQLERARGRMIDSAIGSLSDASAEAGKKLKELVKSPLPFVALGACRCILEYSLKYLDYQGVRKELAELQAFVEESTNDHQNRNQKVTREATGITDLVPVPKSND